MESSWRPLVSSISQGWVSGTILFYIFINYLDDRAEYVLRKFVADTKLGRVAEGPCCHPEASQQAGETADGSLMKFNKVKRKVLHLGRNNPTHQYIPETDLLENSLGEKDLILLDTRLNKSEQCALSAKQDDGCIRQNTARRSKEGILLPAQHWQGHAWYSLSSSRHPSTRETWTRWRESSKEHLTYEERLRV